MASNSTGMLYTFCKHQFSCSFNKNKLSLELAPPTLVSSYGVLKIEIEVQRRRVPVRETAKTRNWDKHSELLQTLSVVETRNRPRPNTPRPLSLLYCSCVACNFFEEGIGSQPHPWQLRSSWRCSLSYSRSASDPLGLSVGYGPCECSPPCRPWNPSPNSYICCVTGRIPSHGCRTLRRMV